MIPPITTLKYDIQKTVKGLLNIPTITITHIEQPKDEFSRFDCLVYAVDNKNQDWLFIVESKDRNIPSTRYSDLIIEQPKREALEKATAHYATKYPQKKVAWLVCQTYTDGIMKIGSADSAFYLKQGWAGATTSFANTQKVEKTFVHITETVSFVYDTHLQTSNSRPLSNTTKEAN